jgi:hypothetical protein
MRRLLRVVVGKMMHIPGSSDATTLFFTSCKCIRPRVADVVAITGLGLLPLFAWALGIHDLPRAWPGLDAAFCRTRQFLSDYKAEASRFVKRSLLRLACPKFTLKYLYSKMKTFVVASLTLSTGAAARTFTVRV